MKLSIRVDKLLGVLNNVIGVVPSKPRPFPIIENVLFTRHKDTLTILGTNLEQAIQCRIVMDPDIIVDVESTCEDVLIPAHRLKDVLRFLPRDATADLDLGPGANKLVCSSGRYKFPRSNVDDFPLLQIQDQSGADAMFMIPADELSRILKSVSHAVAGQNEARYYLKGCLLDISEVSQEELKVTTVATDGHRLSMCELSVQGPVGKVRQVILPDNAIKDLVKLFDGIDDNVSVYLGENRAVFETESIKFSTLLIDAIYPSYKRLIPDIDKALHVITANRKELMLLIQSALTIPNIFHNIRLTLSDGKLNIQSQAEDSGLSDVDMVVDYSDGGIEFGANGDYLLDALGVIESDFVAIRVTDPSSMIRIDGVKYESEGGDTIPGRDAEVDRVGSLQIVMPVRL